MTVTLPFVGHVNVSDLSGSLDATLTQILYEIHSDQ